MFIEEYVSKKVKSWSDEILTIAETHPHSAFVHGVVPKWNYVLRTIELVGCLFQSKTTAFQYSV